VARRDEIVSVSGARNGEPVSGHERLDDTFSALEFTHGYNLLTANAMYRFFASSREAAAQRRIRPYLGFGLGIALPHVEVEDELSRTEGYQSTGPVAQGLAGADFPLTRRLSAFTELRLGWADIDVDLDSGGSLAVQPWTGQLALGLTFTF
jgi:lipid A oxidase